MAALARERNRRFPREVRLHKQVHLLAFGASNPNGSLLSHGSSLTPCRKVWRFKLHHYQIFGFSFTVVRASTVCVALACAAIMHRIFLRLQFGPWNSTLLRWL